MRVNQVIAVVLLSVQVAGCNAILCAGARCDDHQAGTCEYYDEPTGSFTSMSVLTDTVDLSNAPVYEIPYPPDPTDSVSVEIGTGPSGFPYNEGGFDLLLPNDSLVHKGASVGGRQSDNPVVLNMTLWRGEKAFRDWGTWTGGGDSAYGPTPAGTWTIVGLRLDWLASTCNEYWGTDDDWRSAYFSRIELETLTGGPLTFVVRNTSWAPPDSL